MLSNVHTNHDDLCDLAWMDQMRKAHHCDFMREVDASSEYSCLVVTSLQVKMKGGVIEQWVLHFHFPGLERERYFQTPWHYRRLQTVAQWMTYSIIPSITPEGVMIYDSDRTDLSDTQTQTWSATFRIMYINILLLLGQVLGTRTQWSLRLHSPHPKWLLTLESWNHFVACMITKHRRHATEFWIIM